VESGLLRAAREQAVIDAETAVSRCLEAAAALERTHALHEEQAGRSRRSRAALVRAARAQSRLEQLRARRRLG
jgi:hypothetical protein